MRTVLPNDTVITLWSTDTTSEWDNNNYPLSQDSSRGMCNQNRYTFRIRECIGKGRMCVAYEVERDNGVIGRLKHFSPRGMALDDPRYDKEQERFVKAFTLQKKLCSSVTTGGTTAYAIDYLRNEEGEQFVFSSYLPGQTLDKVNYSSFSLVLSTVRLLAEAVGAYHNAGYLLLDIKPTNCLVATGQGMRAVQFFDFDSLLNLEKFSLREEIPCSASISSVFCAQELALRQWDEISVRTDLYSIGAILYYLLFKDKENLVFHTQDSFFEADEVKECFVNNFKLHKEKLSEILHKTLDYPPETRYSSAYELIKDLEDLECSCVDDQREMSIVTSYSKCRGDDVTVVFGSCSHYRVQSELEKLLAEAFTNSKVHAIYGERGMGKTELARSFVRQACIQRTRKDLHFEEVVFINAFDKSLREVLASLPVHNDTLLDEKDSYQYKLQCMQRMAKLHPPCLLVVDNFDEHTKDLTVNNPSYRDLLQSGWHVLFTSKVNMLGIPGLQTTEIQSLCYDELCNLFLSISGGTEVEDELHELLVDGFCCNTYLTVLAASLVAQKRYSISQFIQSVKDATVSLLSRTPTGEKDGHRIERDSLFNLYASLYSMSFISQSSMDLQLMELLALVPPSGVEYDRFLKYSFSESERQNAENHIAVLVDHYWVFEREDRLSLHPLVREMVLKEVTIKWPDISRYATSVITCDAPVTQVVDVTERLERTKALFEVVKGLDVPILYKALLAANIASGYDILTMKEEASSYAVIAVDLLYAVNKSCLSPEEQFLTARAYSFSGYAILHRDNEEQTIKHACRILEEAADIACSALEERPDDVEMAVLKTQIRGNLGAVAQKTKDYNLAWEYHKLSEAERVRMVTQHKDEPRFVTLLATARRNVGSDHYYLAKSSATEEERLENLLEAYYNHKGAIHLFASSLGYDHLELVISKNRMTGTFLLLATDFFDYTDIDFKEAFNIAFEQMVENAEWLNRSPMPPKDEVDNCLKNTCNLLMLHDKHARQDLIIRARTIYTNLEKFWTYSEDTKAYVEKLRSMVF